MYQKNEGKFLKHLDFLILDLIIVEATYIGKRKIASTCSKSSDVR